MNHLKVVTLIMLIICMTLPGIAPAQIGKTVVHLKSGKKLLPPDKSTDFNRQELIGGHYYRYLQFKQIPNPQQRQLIRQADIRLLEYLPDLTYLAALPSDLNVELFRQLEIQAVAKIEPQDKLAPPILRRFDRETSPQEFIVQFQKDIPSDLANYILRQNHLEIISTTPSTCSFQIYATPNILERLLQHPAILYAELPPETYPEDSNGSANVRANTLQLASGGPLNGQGVHIAIGDDGFIGPHIDFQGRAIQSEIEVDQDGAHGDMVAGILAGAGNLHPDNRGVASGATLHLFSGFEAVEKAEALYLEKNVVITSTSYGDGCNRGYTTFTQLADRQIYDNPPLMHVFSTGNSGDQDCGYGAGSGWGNITGGVKVGKNVLAVGNVSAEDEIVYNSSRGPANDGRIKPDICANGDGQQSTAPNNTYQTGNGSSAAAPVVSGVLAQMVQAYRETHNNSNPSSALLKACLLNSAEDLGTPGPDFVYGWGRVNARRAMEALTEEQYFSGEVDQSNEQDFSLTIPEGVGELRIMLYWHDVAGSPASNRSLVNDLDLKVLQNGNISLPWTLKSNPATLGQAAIRELTASIM